jgi:hypothetical protein
MARCRIHWCELHGRGCQTWSANGVCTHAKEIPWFRGQCHVTLRYVMLRYVILFACYVMLDVMQSMRWKRGLRTCWRNFLIQRSAIITTATTTTTTTIFPCCCCRPLAFLAPFSSHLITLILLKVKIDQYIVRFVADLGEGLQAERCVILSLTTTHTKPTEPSITQHYNASLH